MLPTDDRLVAAALDGDPAAYDALMNRHESLVYRVAYGFAGERDGALDIVQSTFLKALRSLARFQRRSAFTTWLTRIALNEGLDWQKRHARLRARHLPLDAAERAVASGPGPEESALAAEAKRRVALSLATLRRKYRVALTLRYLDGLSVPEVAEALSCSEDTARNVLYRGLKRLRAALSCTEGIR